MSEKDIATQDTSLPTSMRSRRIDNEWGLLEALQKANPDRLRIERAADRFTLEVTNMAALAALPSAPVARVKDIKNRHTISMVFPRFYPSMPIECYMQEPVFHPNVHPDTGYVCLWEKHRVQTTCEQTLYQLQRVLAWQLLNANPEHLLQPEAFAWYNAKNGDDLLPLTLTPWQPVHDAEMEDTGRRSEPVERRQRLYDHNPDTPSS